MSKNKDYLNCPLVHQKIPNLAVFSLGKIKCSQLQSSSLKTSHIQPSITQKINCYGKANCTATVKKAGYEPLSIKVASSASKLIKVSMAPVVEVAPPPVVYAETKVEAKPSTPAPLPKVEIPSMVGQVLKKNL